MLIGSTSISVTVTHFDLCTVTVEVDPILCNAESLMSIVILCMNFACSKTPKNTQLRILLRFFVCFLNFRLPNCNANTLLVSQN